MGVRGSGWKRWAVVFGGLILGGMVFAGCGQEQSAEKKEKVRLEFYNRKREVYGVLDEIIQLFNESQDEIEVYQNMNTNSDVTLRIAAVNGNFPDIVELGGLQSVESFEYVMGGYLLPLDSLVSMERVKEEYLPYLRYDGHIYQVPLAMSFEGIYLNRDLFKQEGLEIPETYEELIHTAGEIQNRGKTAFLFADGNDWTIHQNWECIEGAYRGNFQEFWTAVALGETSFDQDEISRGALEKLMELHDYTNPEYEDADYDEAMRRFAAGESFMFMQGSWALRNIMELNPELNVEMIPFPVEEGNVQKVTLWVDSSVGISRDCRYPEEAQKFLEFLTEPEILQMYLDDERSLSCVEGVADRADYAPRINSLIEQGQAVMDASWLPLQTSVIRDKDIAAVMPRASESELTAYLKKYTKSLQKHGDLYLEAKEKVG
ncbi:MAG: extracellular solute-binding protein [Eubacteriales bacterium]|nr:extracellular solute-binding protein [Eubacteriales bacterium]